MSHSTVTVVIRDAANAQEAEAQLEGLLEPFDENGETDPYPVWLSAEEVEHAAKMYREHPEFCPGGQDKNEDHGGPVKPFDEYVTEGNLEAWDEWTRMAIGAYHGNGRDSGIYDAEGDRFGYLSTYNPDSRWDWWALGGRWHGFYLLKPKVSVGSEPLPPWQTSSPLFRDKVEGAQQVPGFDGSQDALLGNAGVGGDDPEENFEARADLARKGDIDFDAMRVLTGQRAEAQYDAFEEATKDLPLPESWQETVKRVYFDNSLDPDETFDGYLMSKQEKDLPGKQIMVVEGSTGDFVDPLTGRKPAQQNTDAEYEAWNTRRQQATNQAREQYTEQPWIKALSEAGLDSFFGDPLEDWCVHDGGRTTYVQRAIDGTTGTFAVLMDGQWHEKGQMGWFGMVGGEKDQSTWDAQQRRLIDSLPDDVYLAIVDVHI